MFVKYEYVIMQSTVAIVTSFMALYITDLLFTQKWHLY